VKQYIKAVETYFKTAEKERGAPMQPSESASRESWKYVHLNNSYGRQLARYVIATGKIIPPAKA